MFRARALACVLLSLLSLTTSQASQPVLVGFIARPLGTPSSARLAECDAPATARCGVTCAVLRLPSLFRLPPAASCFCSDAGTLSGSEGGESGRVNLSTAGTKEERSPQPPFSSSPAACARGCCSGHSASTFNLSKEDLFYLNSRGLENSDIKNLIIKSLSENFIKNIEDEEIKNEILNLINERIYDK